MPEERTLLEAELMLEEILAATKALGKTKAPRHDGVLAEFFMAFWDQIGPSLLAALKFGLEQGPFRKNFLKWLIILLFKKGKSLKLRIRDQSLCLL